MKLLASDFDNTLFFHEDGGIIHQDDIDAIEQFQKDGHLFGICTGRDLFGIDRCISGVKLDFYILNSGAIILDKDRNPIQKKILDKNKVVEIIKDVNEKLCYTFSIDGKMIVLNNDTDYFDQLETIESLDDLPEGEIGGFSIHFKNEKECNKYTQIVNQYDGFVGYQNKTDLDIVHDGCSKGNGIKVIQKYFNIDNEDINAIGDSWNDIPMLDTATYSYTFNSSPEDVKQRANYLVDSIAKCIENIEK